MKHQPLFDIVTQIVEDICEYKEDLKVFIEPQGKVTALLVIPHNADKPKLIGKSGRQVNAMKYLVSLAGQKLGVALDYQIKEGFIGEREPVIPFAYAPDFDLETLRSLMQKFCTFVLDAETTIKCEHSGDRVVARIALPRTARNESIVAALDAVFYAWSFPRGRKLKLQAEFINHENTPTDHQRR